MQMTPLALDGVMLLQPTRYSDSRGFFLEHFNQQTFSLTTGLEVSFVQDNYSHSTQHVIRGLHFQYPLSQGKLIQLLQGHIYDVVVDLRPHSASFGQWIGMHLHSEQQHQLWVPEGFAHGFAVISPQANVLYKTTRYYAPQHEHTLQWNDPTLAIDWPLMCPPILSEKDKLGKPWHEIQQLLLS